MQIFDRSLIFERINNVPFYCTPLKYWSTGLTYCYFKLINTNNDCHRCIFLPFPFLSILKNYFKRHRHTAHILDNHKFIIFTVFKITLKTTYNYLKYIIIARNTGKQADLSGLPAFIKRTITK